MKETSNYGYKPVRKNLKSAVKSAPKSLILPETSDPRVLEAINILASEKSCKEIGILDEKEKFLEFSKITIMILAHMGYYFVSLGKKKI